VVTFSTPPIWDPQKTEGSLGPTFVAIIRAENDSQGSFYPYVLCEISVLTELPFGRLRYYLTSEPPQSNSQTAGCLGSLPCKEGPLGPTKLFARKQRTPPRGRTP